MRQFTSRYILALVAMALLLGIAAPKPSMTPTQGELLIQEGEKLKIACKGKGRIQFSTQMNMARDSHSRFNVLFNNESDWYTFTRPRAMKEDTGWYGCAEEGIEIQNDEQTIDHPETNISWIYVYVNSSRPFAIDTSGRINQYDYWSVLVKIPLVVGRKVIVPCRPTSPDVPVILEIDDGATPVPKSTKYDPKIGFIMNEHLSQTPKQLVCQCLIEGFNQSANSSRPFNHTFPAYTLATLDEIYVSPRIVACGHRGKDLRITCKARIPIAGGTVSVDWDIPKFISARRVTYETISPIDDIYDNWILRILTLKIKDVETSDNGRYRCVWRDLVSGFVQLQTTLVWVLKPGEVPDAKSRYVNLNQDAVLSCDATWYDYVWAKVSDSENTTHVIPDSCIWPTNKYEIKEYLLIIYNVSRNDNGTYGCRAESINGPVTDEKYLIVTEVPEVKMGSAKAVSTGSVYLHWIMIYDGNEPINIYYIQRMKNGTDEWKNCSLTISGRNSSYVVKGLERSTAYRFRIYASNSIGTSLPAESDSISTLAEDPVFVPTISAIGFSNTSMIITWSAPPVQYQDLVHYHKIEVTHSGSGNVSTHRVTDPKYHTLTHLETGMKYNIKVAACSNYTEECGDWSTSKEAVALNRDPNESKLDSSEISWIVVGILVILVLVMAIWVAIWTKIRKRSELAARRRFIEATIEVFKSGDRSSVNSELEMAAQAELLPYDKKWEFPRKLLKLGKTLGSGAFGTVKKAEAESICKGQKYSTVAVKMVRVTHRLDHMMALQRELKILVHLGKHINIVNMLGACTNRISYGELLVIVDFCRFGNLHDYLLRRRSDFVDQVDGATGAIAGPSFRMDCVLAIDNDTNTVNLDDNPATEECRRSTSSNDTSVIVDDPASSCDRVEPVHAYNYHGDFTDSDLEPIGTRDLLCWAWQVSRGMNYLSSKRVVHADLATRNILLADNNTVKICDFGLAKSLYADDIYKKEGNGPLPVKWMAIESIGDRVFSIKSDVWSFGVVLWELFALAKTPYPGIANESIYTKLVDGFRMEKPEYATEQMYRVMLSCWEAEPLNRPSFKELEEICTILEGEGIAEYGIPVVLS